ncbi:MAG: hypothetical protein J1E16_04335 [Muribaculaceae bacterium]|nr:hypothetical protein [Muribaculaceae bacterium]
MTKLERYQAQLKELEQKEKDLFSNGRYMQSISLHKKIDEIKAMIEEIRPYYEPRPLSESVTPQQLKEMNIVPLMIECHLIADFLTEVCYMVVDTVKAHGFDNISFVPELKEIIKRTDKFASFLNGMSPGLQDLLLRNETFNASLHKKFLKHIDQRLAHFKKEKNNETNKIIAS